MYLSNYNINFHASKTSKQSEAVKYIVRRKLLYTSQEHSIPF